MKIALIGYGKMGRLIEEIALKKQYQIVSKITSTSNITKENLQDADICIDFSRPDAALENILEIARLKKSIVIGTTGWETELERVKGVVNDSNIGFLYSPNFSIGIHLFLKIIEKAASLIDNYSEYDIAGSESHHKHKADSPSGTAKAIAQTLIHNIQRKNKIVYETTNQPLQPNELHFSSLRCGSIVGTHDVLFDSNYDTITLTHEARNREGFAYGALRAAEWLQGKSGFFTMEDII